MKHVSMYISGRVQGVNYRAATKAVADISGVRGIVKNLPDGRVYIEAEGPELRLDAFIDWCRQGPDEAQVVDVAIEPGEVKGYKFFEVIKQAGKIGGGGL